MGDPFRTTRWSLVLAAADGEPRSGEALEWLCATYWYPLYAFVRRRGHDPDTARDLTQSFFLSLLDRRFFAGVDPQRGRFRAFLLATMKNFLAKEREREGALKRRTNDPAFRVHLDEAEANYGHEPSADLDPEALYERRWALTILDRARDRLAGEYERADHPERFHALKAVLAGESGRSYREIAAELGMTEGAVKVAVLRMRRRLGTLLRQEVAQTVAGSDDVEAEVRHLLRALER